MSAPHPELQPVPQGDYLPARRHRDLIFTSGMTPREAGVLKYHGPISILAPVDAHADAVRLACRNALAAASARLGEGEAIGAILSLTVYIAAEPGFTAHSRLADFASGFLREKLGDAAIGARAAIGVATLPGNASIEIALVAAVENRAAETSRPSHLGGARGSAGSQNPA